MKEPPKPLAGGSNMINPGLEEVHPIRGDLVDSACWTSSFYVPGRLDKPVIFELAKGTI